MLESPFYSFRYTFPCFRKGTEDVSDFFFHVLVHSGLNEPGVRKYEKV